MVFFAWGRWFSSSGARAPRCHEVYVVAKQWMWKLEHAEDVARD